MQSFEIMKNSGESGYQQGITTYRHWAKQPNNNPEVIKNRKISLESNRTADTVDESKQSIREVRGCKICLAEIDIRDFKKENFISPCLCTGSMKFVHQECLKSWVNSIVQRNLENKNNTYKIQCQICKTPYQYDIFHKLQCVNKAEFRSRIKLKRQFLAISFVFILICLIGIGVLGYFTFTGKIRGNQDHPQINYSVFIAFSTVLFLLFLIWIVALVWVFLIKRKGYVDKIREKQKTKNPRASRNSKRMFGL